MVPNPSDPGNSDPGNSDAAAFTVVMFADLHLERQFVWADAGAASRRRLALRTTLENIVELAIAQNADAILCGGDLYEDEFFSPDLAHFVASTLDCGLPVLCAAGNHDHLSRASLYSRASLPATVRVFDAPAFSPIEVAPGVSVWGASHVTASGTAGFFDGRNAVVDPADVASTDVNIALFHGSERAGFSFEGADKSPHAPFDASQVAHAGFDYAFVGHHHHGVHGQHHCYPGNPDPLEFGETGQRGAVVARFAASGGAPELTTHDVGPTVANAVSIDISACRNSTEVHREVAHAAEAHEGWLRVDLFGGLHPDVELDLAQLQSAGADLDGFVVRADQVRRAFDLDAIRDEESSVRSHFVRLAEADASLDSTARARVVELGLRAFENRRDLEVLS